MTIEEKIQQALTFLNHLFADGDVFEIRTIGPKKTRSKLFEGYAAGRKPIISGYFNDKEKAAELAVKIDEELSPDGVYVTINPCKPELKSRAYNRFKVADEGSTTKDHEIDCIRILPIDIDPIRPTKIDLSDRNENKSLVTIPVTISNACDDIEKIPSQRKAACSIGFGDSDDSDDKLRTHSKESVPASYEKEVF